MKETLRERAHRWMSENPQVMHLFHRFAMELMQRKVSRLGVKAIAERVRWECFVMGYETPKINNSFTAYIARELAKTIPGFADRIETRRAKSADRPYKEPVMGEAVDPLTEQPLESADAC